MKNEYGTGKGSWGVVIRKPNTHRMCDRRDAGVSSMRFNARRRCAATREDSRDSRSSSRRRMERVLVNNWSMREDGWIGEHCVIISSAEEIVVDVS
jgi:hypothetical protein